MIVKIVWVSSDTYWYARHKGKEFEVEDYDDGSYVTKANNSSLKHLIKKSDCEIINK